MNRITESINNVRVDKAVSGDYAVTFTITQTANGLDNISVIGTKNDAYAFSITYNALTSATGINFATAFDFVIAQAVMNEIEDIKTELELTAED